MLKFNRKSSGESRIVIHTVSYCRQCYSALKSCFHQSNQSIPSSNRLMHRPPIRFYAFQILNEQILPAGKEKIDRRAVLPTRSNHKNPGRIQIFSKEDNADFRKIARVFQSTAATTLIQKGRSYERIIDDWGKGFGEGFGYGRRDM